MKKTVYLIDASPFFYKAFFAIPPLSSKNGVPTNAVYGYTNTIIKFLKKFNPEYVGVCFDRKSKFRTELLNSYKEDRKPMDSRLQVQVPLVKQVTESFGLRVFEKEGFEADDLIGMLTKFYIEKDFQVIILSPDKDMCQLVGENCVVYDLSKDITYNSSLVKEKFGVAPHQIVDLLALSGDQVDGIPGVPGIGSKTAIKLINEYGSSENIYENIEKLKGAMKLKFVENKNLAEISKQLATIQTEMKLNVSHEEDLKRGFLIKDEMKSLFDALNFLSLKSKLDDID